jgi:hypothetical protein
VPLKGRRHKLRFGFRLKTREPNAHDSRVKQTLAEHEFSEILVGGRQDRV